jgi:CheY-like chemotaxis protein
MPQTKQIYMLEDDMDDRLLVKTEVKDLEAKADELGFIIDIQFFTSSTEFINFLQSATKGSLILLDYNSRPEPAIEVLKAIKKMEGHKGTPIVILSDSTVEKYKEECYALGASSFIQKPSKAKRTSYMIEGFFTYWFTIVGA